MKRVHLIVGVVVVLAFLLTGQYMDRCHDHLRSMPDGPRMLYRTRHIFILLAGALNLGVGLYFVWRARLWRRRCQLLGSLLIILGPALFIAAFFYEPTLQDLHTPLSHWGTYVIAAGVSLHVIGGLGDADDA